MPVAYRPRVALSTGHFGRSGQICYHPSVPPRLDRIPDTGPGQSASLRTVARLLPFLRPYRVWVAGGLACLVLRIIAELYPPLVWGYVVDTFLKTGRLRDLLIPIGTLVVSYALTAGFNGAQSYLLTRASQGFIFDLRRAVYGKLQEQPLSYFQDRRTGDLLSRTVNDVDTVQDVLISGMESILASGLRLVGVAFIFIRLQPILGTACVMPMLGVAIALYFYNRRIKDVYRRIRRDLGGVTAKLQDNLSGISVIKAFAREDHEESEFADAARTYYEATMEGVAVRSVFFPFVRFIAFTGQIIMLGLGAWLVWIGQFTVGGLVTYRGYGRYFYGPVDDLMGVNDLVQRASAGAERIFEVLDHVPAVRDRPEAKEMPRVRGEVEFRDVSFSYRRERSILTGISLKAAAGQTVGLFGPSGVGKTTLMNLIARFYDVTGGAVLIDGVDVRDVTQASLRRQIGVVQQETFLFNASVADNIRYGRLEATDEDVVEAARMANAHEFILDLEDGYATEIGERGTKLSGGQRQRIAIARCFLANPGILLMDEPTSAVEPDSERIIIEALQSLSSGRTAFIVSHRMSLLRQADVIACLEGGVLKHAGTHEEMLAASDAYRRASEASE